MYHFAFKVADPAELASRRDALAKNGVEVRGIVDHGWCQSIYFHDPNHLQLEFCCLTATLAEEHRAGRFTRGWTDLARR